MTQQLNRSQLMDEVIALNEEAEYHADQVVQLQRKLDEATNLLRAWWGAKYTSAYCNAVLEATEEFLTEQGRNDAPRIN